MNFQQHCRPLQAWEVSPLVTWLDQNRVALVPQLPYHWMGFRAEKWRFWLVVMKTQWLNMHQIIQETLLLLLPDVSVSKHTVTVTYETYMNIYRWKGSDLLKQMMYLVYCTVLLKVDCVHMAWRLMAWMAHLLLKKSQYAFYFYLTCNFMFFFKGKVTEFYTIVISFNLTS